MIHIKGPIESFQVLIAQLSYAITVCVIQCHMCNSVTYPILGVCQVTHIINNFTIITLFLNPYRKSSNFNYKFHKLLVSLFSRELYIRNKYKWRHVGPQIIHTISSNVYNIKMTFRATSVKQIVKPLKHMIYIGQRFMNPPPPKKPLNHTANMYTIQRFWSYQKIEMNFNNLR